jgi:heme oxygenase (biliverdin-producing, ferredoxin)
VVDVIEQPVGRSAAALRLATQDTHLLTEQEPFIAELMSGTRSREDLARLTGQLRSVYAAIESIAPAFRSDPILGRLFDPRLDRLATIDADLAHLGGSAATQLIEVLPATAAYVARILAARESRARIVAHHYVRYLGDLSGGQIIAMLMRRHYGIEDEALTFYAFDGLGSKGGFKATYRTILDELLVDQAFFDEVVAEARLAYEANRQVFAALGAAGASSRAGDNVLAAVVPPPAPRLAGA